VNKTISKNSGATTKRKIEKVSAMFTGTPDSFPVTLANFPETSAKIKIK
jgi:hypothetical protein